MWSRRIGPGWLVGFAVMVGSLPGFAQVYSAAATAPAGAGKIPAVKRARVRQLDDEVQVVPPIGPVMLAQEFELKLEGETSTLSRISVTQWTETPEGQWREVYQGFTSGPGERRGDAVVVKVAPFEVGKVQLRVTGTGKAGDEVELLHKDVWVDVAAPAGPIELRFGSSSGLDGWEENGSRSVTARLGLKGTARPQQMDLKVEAIYGGVLKPQPVSASEIQYRVRAGQRVVAIDPRTGVVRGLKAGHALVEAAYGGMTTKACVVVEGDGVRGGDCGNLVR